ncbi:MAG: glutamate mutase L, partial [Treponema sp.]|nr:glutamate mutase L [Treponema sp.]
MNVDLFVAEIGSTTTVVNAIDGIGSGKAALVGQGQAATTVTGADGVVAGLREAIAAMGRSLGTEIACGKMLA